MGRVTQGLAAKAGVLIALSAIAACDDAELPVSPSTSTASAGNATGGGGAAGSPALATGGTDMIVLPPVTTPEDLGATCDPKRGADVDGAHLLVRDPELLADFSLERVLTRLMASASVRLPPEQFMQRLFDTENVSANGAFPDVMHCDTTGNAAFATGKAVDCPRAEGRLATSQGFFTPGHRDFFAPVALVNRFDLTPSDASTCGEYRIVYAKQSGLTDPNDRVFLIFEAALFNDRVSLGACRPVAELWAGLSRADLDTQRQQLSALYFEGVGGLEPVLTAAHLSGDTSGCRYTGRCGQIRVGQGMQEPFQFRQFRLETRINLERANQMVVAPTPDAQSPRPELFELRGENAGFIQEILNAATELASPEVSRIRASMHPSYDAGESAISGPARPNFAERLAAISPEQAKALSDGLAPDLGRLDESCPNEDPLTSDAIIQRATALTCAGCHAPDQLLAEGRKLGCGAIWPKSLGSTHIDERGELSPALTDVFLPHRARVLSTFLQACDPAAIRANLQPVATQPIVECFPPGTPITLASGAEKPIEQVQSGEWVLSFDLPTRMLVPVQVESRVVRQNARRFVRINERLVATDNHPFFTEAGWVRAEDLRVGVPLAFFDGADVRLSNVEQLKLESGEGPTYNLRVEGTHNYFAGGMLVHDRP